MKMVPAVKNPRPLATLFRSPQMAPLLLLLLLPPLTLCLPRLSLMLLGIRS